MILLDAGPLYAVLNRSDEHHGRCVEALKGITVPLITTWPAFTEAMYLLGADFGWHGQRKLWEMYRRQKFSVAEPTPELTDRAYELMEKYCDLPMDLADATLVALGEERGIRTVFTVDRSDFGAYRLHGRKSFNIIPA